MKNKPTPIEFLKRFVADTASLLSGGLSIPSTVLSLYSDNKYAKISFAAVAVLGFLIASYRLWAGERRSTLAMQERLAEEINKRGRPEITVELKGGDGKALHACLMNYASPAAINLRIDDIPCGDGVLRFENIPTMISSGFSPNLQCYFFPSDGGPKRSNVGEELIVAKMQTGRSATVLTIRYTDSDGVLDWVTKCDFTYDSNQKKIVLLKQRIEDGEAENAIRELREYDHQKTNPSQRAIRWLREGEYIATTDAKHMLSSGSEYLVTDITDKGRLLLERKPVEEPQSKLLGAQLEEIEARKKSRQASEEHEGRMKSLTAPDSGIRPFVAARRTRANSTEAFTVDMLATALSAPHAEIEEALRILRSRGFAKETSLPGHWFIDT
jgi:hypothetical protein